MDEATRMYPGSQWVVGRAWSRVELPKFRFRPGKTRLVGCGATAQAPLDFPRLIFPLHPELRLLDLSETHASTLVQSYQRNARESRTPFLQHSDTWGRIFGRV
jgi:hypothetical protein